MWFLDKQRIKRRWQSYRRLRIGRRGEDLACKFLRRQGFFIWKRNWRCRHGELDIIAYNDSKLRIIEVKTRSGPSAHSFPAIDAIDADKTKRIERLAHSFVLRKRKAMRIRRLTSINLDAITVLLSESWFVQPVITHIENIGDGINFG